MKKLLLPILCVGLLFTGCGEKTIPVLENGEEVVAKLDGKDITANDIADQKIVFAFSGGSDSGDKLGQRGTQSDDSKRNDTLRYTDGRSNSRGGIHYKFTTGNDTS